MHHAICHALIHPAHIYSSRLPSPPYDHIHLSNRKDQAKSLKYKWTDRKPKSKSKNERSFSSIHHPRTTHAEVAPKDIKGLKLINRRVSHLLKHLSFYKPPSSTHANQTPALSLPKDSLAALELFEQPKK